MGKAGLVELVKSKVFYWLSGKPTVTRGARADPSQKGLR